jgi:hypothetical protein
VLPLLALIDGKRDGWSLLEALPKEMQRLDERFLVETLEKWMKAAQGEVLIDGTVPPRAIAETLYKQRISAYDEPTVVRLLVQLRRDSIIALGEGPTP